MKLKIILTLVLIIGLGYNIKSGENIQNRGMWKISVKKGNNTFWKGTKDCYFNVSDDQKEFKFSGYSDDPEKSLWSVSGVMVEEK